MRTVDNSESRRYVYKVIDSPVGRLTLVASDAGLAAILWPDDRPGRVRLPLPAHDDTHPVLVDAERQLEEYFAGRRTSFALPLDPVGNAIPAQGMGRTDDDPIRRRPDPTARSPARSDIPMPCARSAPPTAGTRCRSSPPAIA